MVVKITKTDILGALPKLSKADLEAVHAMAGHLLGGATGAIAKPLPPYPQAVFDALTATLGLAVAYETIGPQWQKRFLAQMRGLFNFLDMNFPTWAKKKIVQKAFLREMFSWLERDLKSSGVSLTLGVMIKHSQ